MGVRLIPRLRPWLKVKELLCPLLNRVSIADFENDFATKFKAKHGICFSHGRVGLYSFLKSMGIEQKEVICPAYNCVVVSHAVVLSGNIPVFVDSRVIVQTLR